MHWYSYLRIILMAIPVIALGFFVYQYTNPSGVIAI